MHETGKGHEPSQNEQESAAGVLDAPVVAKKRKKRKSGKVPTNRFLISWMVIWALIGGVVLYKGWQERDSGWSTLSKGGTLELDFAGKKGQWRITYLGYKNLSAEAIDELPDKETLKTEGVLFQGENPPPGAYRAAVTHGITTSDQVGAEETSPSAEANLDVAWQAAEYVYGTRNEAADMSVEVSEVKTGSIAEQLGIRPGDRLKGYPDERIDAALVDNPGTALSVQWTPVGKETKTLILPKTNENNPDSTRGMKLRGEATTRPATRAGYIKGPSAGLMSGLTYLASMDKGDLSGGLKIAGTGTMDSSGHVAAVGGVEIKVKAARDWGADVFFVPYVNAADAEYTAGGKTQVVPVSDIREAVSWLCLHGSTGEICSRWGSKKSSYN